jgi:hypothetical protein
MSKAETKQTPIGLLLKLSPELMSRFKSLVPVRQRTSVITALVQSEVERRERELELVARQVEADSALNDEMSEWNVTIADGIDEHVPAYDEAR